MKVLFDTNVYFEALQEGPRAEQLIVALSRWMPSTWLSSVVLYEMLCGAKSELDRARVRRSVRTLESVGRVVSPTSADWARAGNVQGMLWDENPGLRQKRLQNDILIASSANRIGARVVTTNRKDFELIARFLPHEISSPEGLLA
jgi:predicted nucleic acid-binding protein